MSRYERIVVQAGYLAEEVRSLLAGSSRAVRLSFPDSADDNMTTVNSVAAGVVSPLVLLYVWWILRDAHNRGTRRLYFLARDGHILKKVAEHLVDRWGIEIELRYLYCSRESLLLPSFQRVTDFERYWISWGYLSRITIDEICSRLNLEVNDIMTFATGDSLPDVSAPLDEESLSSFLSLLDHDGVRKLILERNQKQFEDTLGYLRQEGFSDNVPYAIVDTGWKGTSQFALSSILERAQIVNGDPLTGYYLGVNEGAFIHKNSQLKPFLFDWSQTTRDYRLYNFLCFEMLFATNHGRTKGYLENDNSFEPLFEGGTVPEPNWMIEAHHKAACDYACHVTKLMGFADYPEGASRLCRELMREFISAPGPAEAEVYGDYLIASEIREEDMQKIAPEMTLRDFLRVAFGKSKVRGYWPQASFVRSGLHMVNRGYGLFLDTGLLDVYRKYFLKY